MAQTPGRPPSAEEVISARLAILDALAIDLETRQRAQEHGEDRIRPLEVDPYLPITRWFDRHPAGAAALPAVMFSVLIEFGQAIADLKGPEALSHAISGLRAQAAADLETVELEQLLHNDPNADDDPS